MNIAIEDRAVEDYYKSHKDAFAVPDRIHLKQILLSLPADASEAQTAAQRKQAESIYNEAKKGRSFEELVSIYSDGPERKQGGDLGFFNQGELSAPIDQAVFGKGRLIPPVKSPLGFHVFMVERKETARYEPLEKVRKEIEEKLLAEARAVLQAKWMDDLFERAYIDIKP